MSKLGILGTVGAGCLLALGCGSEPDTGTSFTQLTPAPKLDGDPANGALFAVDISFWEKPHSQAEMDCYWDSGVRHVIAGTQVEHITRQQLAMAVSRGMSVDAYVYLYWDIDMTAQVKQAFQRVSGFPIGRMWLDIEQDPGGRSAKQLIEYSQQALTACKAQGTAECGIYTGPGYWKTHMDNTKVFAAVPLWWAHYDYKTSLSTWQKDAFGGWTNPVAKQWATQPLCGVGGVDWNSMKVSAQPTVIVDRSVPPDTGLPPPAPGGLWPVDGTVLPVQYAKVMSETIPLATMYDVAVESWNGSKWIPYHTWSNPNAFVKFDPVTLNALYRFRVRAKNSHGWGAWSAWSMFQYGKYTGAIPSAPPGPDAGSPPDAGGGTPDAGGGTPDAGGGTPDAGPAPQPPPGVPGSLTPDGNALVASSNVVLTCSPVGSATGYEFAIESQSTTGYVPYFTYAATTPSRTFYPQKHGASYRWRVRAKTSAGFGGWSSYATFKFE